MIFTERKITVRKGKSSIDEPVILYRGDFEVELRFTIMETKYRFKSGVNLVDSEKASHAQLALLAPDGANVFTEVGRCEDGTAIFVLSKEMIDELSEVGLYSFQIRLFDYYRESRITIPPIEFGIEVREPIAAEDHTNAVDDAIVGYSIAKTSVLDTPVGPTFDGSGQYNKTKWETGDRISEGKLDKIEDAIYKINQNELNDVADLDRRVTNNFNTLNTTKANVTDVNSKIWSMKNMGQDVKEAMTGGSVAVVGKDAILTENIVDRQVTGRKIAENTIGPGNIVKQLTVYNPANNTANHIANRGEDGAITPFTGYEVTEFIPIEPGDTVEIADGRLSELVVLYDADKKCIGRIIGYPMEHANEPYTHTFPHDTEVRYIRVNINMNGPFYNSFYIIINGITKAGIDWLEIKKENLDSDLSTTINSSERIFDEYGNMLLSAIPGYMPPTVATDINIFDKNTVDMNHYLNGLGSVITNESFPNIMVTDFISVKPSTEYTIASDYVSILYDEYNQNKTFIRNIKSEKRNTPLTFTTSKDTFYVRVNIATNVISLDDYYFVEGTEYNPNVRDWSGNLFDKETIDNNSIINSDGVAIPNTSYPHIVLTDYIEVPSDTLITINFEGVSNWLSEYDEDKKHIQHHNGNAGVVPRNIRTRQNTRYVRININTNTITLDDFYVMVPGLRNYETFTWLEKRLDSVLKSIPSTPSTPSTGGSGSDIITSRFSGMTVLVTGDSITEKNFRANLNWHDYLKQWYGWAKVYNDGKSGSGLVKNTGIVYRLPNWQTNYGTADTIDMILIMGPMNDGTSGDTGRPEWLGTFEDQDDSKKTASLYGALHYTCKEIIRMYPNIPVGFIISQPRSQVGDQGKCWGRDAWFEKWVDAVNEVCGHYSIPVLDLYHNSGLRPWNAENNKMYFSCSSSPDGDGIHPNDLGQELMARKIYEFINRYM